MVKELYILASDFYFNDNKSVFKVRKSCCELHNNNLNLCVQVENSKWILCSRESGVKCGYLRF